MRIAAAREFQAKDDIATMEDDMLFRTLVTGVLCFSALAVNKAEAQRVRPVAPLPCFIFDPYPAVYAPQPARAGRYICYPPRYRMACYDTNTQQLRTLCASPGRWTYIGIDRSR